MSDIIIRLVSADFKNNKVIDECCELTTYISKEWRDLANLCEQPYPCSHSDSCTLMHVWDFQSDCNCRKGQDIAYRLTSALTFLENKGIYPVQKLYKPLINKSNPKWIYSRERLEIFAYLLNRLLQLALQYPECFFIDHNDQNSPLILEDGTLVERMHASVSPQGIPELSGLPGPIGTYFPPGSTSHVLKDMNDASVPPSEEAHSTINNEITELNYPEKDENSIEEDSDGAGSDKIHPALMIVLLCLSVPIALSMFMKPT